MKIPSVCFSLLFAASLGLSQDAEPTASAIAIATEFDEKKIAAIETYLEENPEASDLDDALSILVDAHLSIGKFEPIPDLLALRYERQGKGPGANIQLIVTEIVRPFIETSIVSDQRDKAKAFLTRVKSDFADSPEGPSLLPFLDQLGAELYLPGVGDSMEIAFTDTTGREIDLEEMKDQVVLVDFWATWCAPCIAKMPMMLEIHDTFHEKGFEIVGISLDDNEASFRQFIEERDIPWPQYFDGKGFGNELAQRYGISSIPATFLVGKGGKIIGANLYGDELVQAIEAALAASE